MLLLLTDCVLLNFLFLQLLDSVLIFLGFSVLVIFEQVLLELFDGLVKISNDFLIVGIFFLKSLQLLVLCFNVDSTLLMSQLIS